MDGYSPHLMPATPIFQELTFSKKVLETNKFWTFQKYFFFISGSNFIGIFNGTLFVSIISVVADTQKETFLASRFNWPPLYTPAIPNLPDILYESKISNWGWYSSDVDQTKNRQNGPLCYIAVISHHDVESRMWSAVLMAFSFYYANTILYQLCNISRLPN